MAKDKNGKFYKVGHSNLRVYNYKYTSPKNEICHHLLSLMLFQTSMLLIFHYLKITILYIDYHRTV